MPLSSPTPNATLCAIESCVVSPTGCGQRAECQGCGALCFNPHATSENYSQFLNWTGLSEQASGGSGVFPDVKPDTPPKCPWPTQKRCIRAHGSLTLRQFKPDDPESRSESTCCAACSSTGAACKAWQLIAKQGSPDETSCWLMANTDTKPDSADSCVAGMPPGYPEPELRTADVVLHWSELEPKPGQYDWSSLRDAAARAKAAGGKLAVMIWTSWQAPLWLYDGPYHVPKLAHNADGSSVVPDYTSTTYQERLRAVPGAHALRDRVRLVPIRERAGGVRA